MTNETEIRIETMADVLEKIPEERIEAFLTDLGEWMRFRHFLKPMIDAGLAKVEPIMVWVDDDAPGIKEVRIRYEIDQENA